MTKITSIQSYIGLPFCLSSNNTPSSPPSCLESKNKALPKEKSDDELPACIGDDYYLSPFVIDEYLKRGDVSGGNGYMNSHPLYQQDWDFNNGDVISGNSYYKQPHYTPM